MAKTTKRRVRVAFTTHARSYYDRLTGVSHRTRLQEFELQNIIQKEAYLPLGDGTDGAKFWLAWDWHKREAVIMVVKVPQKGRVVIASVWGKDFPLPCRLTRPIEELAEEVKKRTIHIGLCSHD